MFPLAPMSPGIRVLTALLLLLPAVFVGAALAVGAGSETGGVLVLTAALVAGAYLFVWLWMRPSRFELSEAGLDLVYPLRRRRVAAADIESAEPVTSAGLREECGLLLRVGAGGLWGGFGMLWSSRGKHLDFAISRTDALVLVRRRSGRPLLLSPARPEEFVEQLRR